MKNKSILLLALVVHVNGLLEKIPGYDSIKQIMGKKSSGYKIDRPISIMRYHIPHNLLYAGELMNKTSCPYDFYSSEIIIPEIVSHRLDQPNEADVFLNPDSEDFDYYLVPHYSSCHFHQCIQDESIDRLECRRRTAVYMKDILDYVEKTYPFWERNQGIDHIFIFTWDEASKLFADKFLEHRLASSIHLTHIGTPTAVSNFDPRKDICIPALRWFYEVEGYEDRFYTDMEDPSKKRPIFAYFRGSFGTPKNEKIYGRGIRSAIKHYGKTDPSLYFVKDQHSEFYWNELRKARYALCPPGWSSWSPRLFDAIVAGTIPVIISDDWVPPFSALIDYSKFSLRVAEKDVHKLTEILTSIPVEVEAELRRNLKAVFERFVYSVDNYSKNDAFENIYELLRRKKEEKMESIKKIMLKLENDYMEDHDEESMPFISAASEDEESVNDYILSRIEL